MRRRELGRGARVAIAQPAKAANVAAAAAVQGTDAELLREVARGDRAAFGELYDRLAPSMLSLGYHLLGSQRDAEDLVHDVFLECWQRAAQYDPSRASVRVWFLVRTRSRALDRIRSARRAAAVPLDGLLDQLVTRTSDSSDCDMLYSILLQLSSEQRTVVELGYFAGYSCAEIADTLALPIGTVKSRMARALQMLRLLLRRYEGAHN
jgi:RNA polymerase sigma-70 factor, ECF subfamily